MIYLVDDDIDDVEIIQEAFAQYEYPGQMLVFHNGQALMDKLLEDQEAKPALILLDLLMPLKEGFETLHEIKTHPLLRTIPVIVLTSSESKEDELKCFQLGCDFFFNKPNSMQEYEQLITVVRKITGVNNPNAV
jgi:CheY-like chemotaxis protein